MTRLPIAWMLMLLVLLAWSCPVHAQLFGKKQKPNPTQRVPELILIVKTDLDERKRAQAAEELRDYDTAVFTEIVPVLADVLLQDKKVSVRLEALGSLAKIRPVSAQAGKAIEKAAADDDSLRVRLQAKTALPKYHLAGYSSKTPPPPAKGTVQTAEPPLAAPKVQPPTTTTTVNPPSTVPIPPVVPPPPPPAEAESVPSDPPIPRPFPPIAPLPAKTAGPSLFP